MGSWRKAQHHFLGTSVSTRTFQLSKFKHVGYFIRFSRRFYLFTISVLTCIGCCSLTIQFYEAPKYCVFTYSLIEADNAYLRLVFVFHEMLFLSHAWSAMSCSNGLCSFEAGNLSLIINQMAKAVDELCRDSTIIYYSDDFTVSTGNSKNDRDDSATAFQFSEKRNYDGESSDVNLDEKRRRGNSRTRSNRSGIEKMSAGISKTYDFRRILYDYQQLMIATEQFNAWVGYKIVGLSICGFCQYISSTTMAFQVIKIPGTGIGDIWWVTWGKWNFLHVMLITYIFAQIFFYIDLCRFYIQDCSVAIYVTFRVFDSMSYVLPASMNFMNSVKKYMGQKGVVSGHIRKFQRTLRPVSLKLGPSPTRREGVLETMEMLVGYYLCVALW